MKILILGAGQVGSSAAYHLSREEANEVTVVDMRPDVLRELQDRLDIRTVVGHAAHPEVLARAGASDADLVALMQNVWRRRADRYSEIRGKAIKASDRVEMYRMGG